MSHAITGIQGSVVTGKKGLPPYVSPIKQGSTPTLRLLQGSFHNIFLDPGCHQIPKRYLQYNGTVLEVLGLNIRPILSPTGDISQNVEYPRYLSTPDMVAAENFLAEQVYEGAFWDEYVEHIEQSIFRTPHGGTGCSTDYVIGVANDRFSAILGSVFKRLDPENNPGLFVPIHGTWRWPSSEIRANVLAVYKKIGDTNSIPHNQSTHLNLP